MVHHASREEDANVSASQQQHRQPPHLDLFRSEVGGLQSLRRTWDKLLASGPGGGMFCDPFRQHTNNNHGIESSGRRSIIKTNRNSNNRHHDYEGDTLPLTPLVTEVTPNHVSPSLREMSVAVYESPSRQNRLTPEQWRSTPGSNTISPLTTPRELKVHTYDDDRRRGRHQVNLAQGDGDDASALTARRRLFATASKEDDEEDGDSGKRRQPRLWVGSMMMMMMILVLSFGMLRGLSPKTTMDPGATMSFPDDFWDSLKADWAAAGLLEGKTATRSTCNVTANKGGCTKNSQNEARAKLQRQSQTSLQVGPSKSRQQSSTANTLLARATAMSPGLSLLQGFVQKTPTILSEESSSTTSIIPPNQNDDTDRKFRLGRPNFKSFFKRRLVPNIHWVLPIALVPWANWVLIVSILGRLAMVGTVPKQQ